MYYLEKVNFTTSAGDQVSFGENSDALPVCDIMNMVLLPDGSIELQKVGLYKKSASGDQELLLDEDVIFWNLETNQVTLAF